MEKNYTYDAFISYRHTEPDRFVAENLHRYIEAFKPPKSILKTGRASRSRIERVFRDKDELPLTSNLEDPIINALKQSEYLIVICSPRLKESAWCKKEIETFIEYHGHEKIFAVLVEGEPENSFPEELLYVDETFYYPDGTSEVTRRSVEPLAADVRGNSKKEILRALKTELLRLLAPMFSVDYDDLRQRHRERKLKKIMTGTAAAAVVCLLIGVGSTIAALHIQKQKERIEEQAEEIQSQAEEIMSQTEEIREQNQTLLENQARNLAEKSLNLLEDGDRMGAVEIAAWALTEYEGIDMPYTPEAKYALTESLHVYDSQNIIKAQYQMAASGIIDFMLVSPDGTRAVTYDRTVSLCIWDVASGDLIDTITDIDLLMHESDVVFLDNDRIAYISEDKLIQIYQISEKRRKECVEADSPLSLSMDPQGEYLAVKTWSSQIIYDAETLTELYELEADAAYNIDDKCYFGEGDIMLYVEEADMTAGAEDERTIIRFVNLSDGTVFASLPIDYSSVQSICFKGQNAYITAYGFSPEAPDIKSGVIACSTVDGTAVWERVIEDRSVSGVRLPYAEGASDIMVYTSTEIYLMEETSGRETGRFSTGSEIVGSGAYKDSDKFVIFTRDGKFRVLMSEEKQLVEFSYLFDCKSENVSEFKVAEDCFLILPYNDNRVTVYKASANPDIVPYEGSVATDGNLENENTDYAAEAADLGIEQAALVTHILYSPDRSVIFVSYTGILEIYRTENMTLLETIEGVEYDINRYLGADREGNIYIAGDGAGYSIDANYRLTARIENLLMLDADGNSLVVGTSDNMYIIPIYTTEELLEMASQR